MKALVLNELGGPEKLAIADVPQPEPAAGEVRVAISHAALNRRDVWITVGKYPRVELPSIGGSDGAGVVDAVGAGVDANLVGKEVVIYPARDWGDDPRCGGANFRVLGMPDQGTFAESICVPATDIAAKPDHLTFEQAAALPLAGLTSWRALVTHGEVKAGQKVLVTGIGGGVATFALLWATHHGAEVYVTSGSKEKLEAAKSLGARDGVSYHDTGWDKAIAKMSGGIDIVIDSAGGPVVNKAMNTLNVGGRFVFFGATLGNPESGLEMAKMFFKQARIQGTTMGMPAEFHAMLDFVRSHRIEPVVDQVVPFTEAVAAHERLWASEQMGKIVLAIS
jgi:NADPH:quinone reductase-like Zn-dependent oxidoreductase|tara:strand:- start:4212 stop:5219 length:1008 start_codon:yes stop_codon:yes gene_type:complete